MVGPQIAIAKILVCSDLVVDKGLPYYVCKYETLILADFNER